MLGTIKICTIILCTLGNSNVQEHLPSYLIVTYVLTRLKNFQIEISLLCNAPLFKINHELYQSDFQFFYYFYQSIYFSFSIQGRYRQVPNLEKWFKKALFLHLVKQFQSVTQIFLNCFSRCGKMNGDRSPFLLFFPFSTQNANGFFQGGAQL